MHQKFEQDFPNFAEEARPLMCVSLYFQNWWMITARQRQFIEQYKIVKSA